MDPAVQQLQQQVQQLTQTVKGLTALLSAHQHTPEDGTAPLRKSIILDVDQSFGIGPAQLLTVIVNKGKINELYGLAISVGPDSLTSGFLNKSQNMQMDFYHQPNDVFSFLRLYRKPAIVSFENTSISVTAGGNTVAANGFDLVTDELAGCLVNIYNSSGDLVETQYISSNSTNSITIVGTWDNSTSGGTLDIYRPVYLGSAEKVLQRMYVQEGTVGGIRFGNGPTAGGQNGLLHMDDAGDLFWRDKSGTLTQLN